MIAAVSSHGVGYKFLFKLWRVTIRRPLGIEILNFEGPDKNPSGVTEGERYTHGARKACSLRASSPVPTQSSRFPGSFFQQTGCRAALYTLQPPDTTRNDVSPYPLVRSH